MEQVTVFKASDGSMFDTEDEAMAHEKMLAVDKNLDGYKKQMLSAGVSEATAQARCSHAKYYIEWNATGTIHIPKERKKAAVGKAQKAA